MLTRVITGNYDYQVDVATGRFLQDFHRQWIQIRGVDWTQARPVRRGVNWVQLDAPHLPGNQPWRKKGTARLRLVKDESVWKVEHIRVLNE